MSESKNVPVVLDGVLAGSSSFLLYSNALPFRPILAHIERRCGRFEPLDIRGEEPEEPALRASAVERLEKAGLLVLMTGQEISAVVQALVREVLDGQVNTRGGVTSFEEARVIVLTSGGQPGPEIRELLGMTMAAEAALRPSRVLAEAPKA